MQLQVEGTTVAIMSETGAVIGVSPKESMQSSLSVSGNSAAVARAVWQLKELHANNKQEDAAADPSEVIEQLDIPGKHFNPIMGAVAEIRDRCGGIMIAMKPPDEP